ncbi:hypothetical protein PIROE2DRAFT_18502 [Piromyces sp. E2]|nr:hypothetical protein PIROE2DRAFT_18502 [Piromyces sp. E2]|eukprot:OUM56754.1 hypothetical protein PIROE2DRAFT_18502 [Piromyces sp. E2]
MKILTAYERHSFNKGFLSNKILNILKIICYCHALTLLNQNTELVNKKLGVDFNFETLNKFADNLINFVKENTNDKFYIIESVLKHDAMVNVYQHFKNGDVMIKAIQRENKNAFKWLKSMKNGMNILIHFVRTKLIFDSYVKTYVSDKRCASQTDKNGRTALFHTLTYPTSLWKLSSR